MAVQLLLIALGLALLVYGANWLVDGASSVARKAGISEFVIGLTIVGFGTSCPELVVSLTGSLQGNADVSLGNVIGSNVFNVLLILGITALIAPIAVSKKNTQRDIPITIFASVLLVIFAISGKTITLLEGLIFLILFVSYLFYCFKFDTSEQQTEETKEIKTPIAILLIIAGLAALIGGGQLFVNNAVDFAKSVGVSDKFIAITLLAGGTSLPELVTCIVAAAKKKNQLALGNILGSNIFNIFLILGCSAVITPLSTASMQTLDLALLTGSTVLLFICSFTGKKYRLDRWEGLILVLLFTAYVAHLSANM